MLNVETAATLIAHMLSYGHWVVVGVVGIGAVIYDQIKD